MPAAIDFAKGTHGKLFDDGLRIRLPVCPQADVQEDLNARAEARGIEVGRLISALRKQFSRTQPRK